MMQTLPTQTAMTTRTAMPQQPPRESRTAQVHTGRQEKVSLYRHSEASQTYSATLSVDSVADRSYDMLRKLVTSMLEEQGVDYQVATGAEPIDISTLSQEEARELIAEDGYFGVEKTSKRIVDFAIAAAGGDAGRLEAIKEGVMDGFRQAEKAFGGQLPDISHATIEAVMDKLDTWAAEAQGSQA